MSFLKELYKKLNLKNTWLLAGAFVVLWFGLFPGRKFLPGRLVFILIAAANTVVLLVFIKIFRDFAKSFSQVETRMSELKNEKEKLNGDNNKAIFDIMALYEFTNILGTSVEYRSMLDLIADAIKRIIDYDRCCLFIHDESSSELYSTVNRGFSKTIESVRIPVEQFWYGKTLRTGQAVLVDDLSKELHQGKGDSLKNIELLGDTQSFIAVPMTIQNKMVGIILIAKDAVSGFSYENLRLLLIIANEAALLIQNMQLYEQVYISSITDGLTRVYNHKYFREQIELQIQKAKEYGFNLSLALIDIDHFKSFNDTYGHQVGDIVLKEVARLIQEAVPADHLVARYGGEEFAVIMPDTGIESAVAFCENIRNKIADHFFQADDKARLKVTVSLGVASFPGHIKNLQRMVEELIDLADEYLYYSKDQGRNRVSCPVWKFI